MTTVFLFCGLSASVMFFLFFVVPNLDNLTSRASETRKATAIKQPTAQPAQQMRKRTRVSV